MHVTRHPAPLPAPTLTRGPLATTLALVRPLARAIDWTPLAVTVPLSLAISAWGAAEPDVALTCLRVAAVLLGAAAAFTLIDPMDASTAALPVPRAHRQWLRTLLALAAVAITWAAITGLVALLSPTALPWPGLTLEAAVLTTTTLAATATAVHHIPDKPAALTGAAVTLLLIAATLPLPTTMWAAPNTPTWPDSHHQWAAALPMAVLVLLRANAHSPASATTSRLASTAPRLLSRNRGGTHNSG